VTQTVPATPSLQALLGGARQAVLADCRHHTGSIARIVRAVGGNVSHVFRVHGDRGSVIVKIRGDRFARIPTLRTDPALIADERRALQIYAQRLPGVFPAVLAFHPQAHTMILTDVFPDGRNLHQHLDTRPATVAEMTRLGATLRRVHDATQTVSTQIRSQGDLWFREHTFDFCLRATGHPVLNRTCEEIAARPDQQLVIGDLAPKNLSLAAGRVAICDLDNVHRSWPGYDLAYILAHLLIHHLRWPEHLPALTQALLTSYQHPNALLFPTEANHALLAAVAAGVVLYRLVSDTVPYPLAGPPALADQYRRQVLRLLDSDTCTVPNLLHAAGART
jgi:Ser/Thr protein kinase RdoA (MazF antagonist)